MKKRKEHEKQKKIINWKVLYFSTFPILTTASNVYAANDPIAAINNLTEFIFNIVTAVGSILLIYGVMQFGISFKSNDPTQKTNGILSIVGGVIICSARFIVSKIIG